MIGSGVVSEARASVAAGSPVGARSALLAAVNRLLAVRFKQRHVLRTAHQGLGFVGKEGLGYSAMTGRAA